MRLIEVSASEQELPEKLKQECSQYISSNMPPIIRGIGGTRDDIIEKRIRSDRMPRDSDIGDTAAFNLLFEYFYHVKTIRNVSLFATTSYQTSSEYGYSSYYVLPVNESKIWHNNMYADSLEDSVGLYFLRQDLPKKTVEVILSKKHGQITLEHLKNNLSPSLFDGFIASIIKKERKGELTEFLQYSVNRPSNITLQEEGIEEVLIIAPNFYGINVNYASWERIKELLRT